MFIVLLYLILLTGLLSFLFSIDTTWNPLWQDGPTLKCSFWSLLWLSRLTKYILEVWLHVCSSSFRGNAAAVWCFLQQVEDMVGWELHISLKCKCFVCDLDPQKNTGRENDWLKALFLMWLSLHCNQEQFKNATTNTFRPVFILIKTMCWLRVSAHTIHFALNNVGFYVLFMNRRFYFSRETFMLY